MLAEADLKDYSGLYLKGRIDGGLGMAAQLSLRYDNRRLAVIRDLRKGTMETPWRVVMLADRAGDLIASNVVGNLNPPTRRAMSAGSSLARPRGTGGPTRIVGIGPDMVDGVDQALHRLRRRSRASRTCCSTRAGSFSGGLRPDLLSNADITARQAEGIDMPELVPYAAGEGRHPDPVGALGACADASMDRGARHSTPSWGVKGVKIDFMDRDDQDIVDFFHRVAEETAKRHILLDMHAARITRPACNRTYPNFITQEGVMGAEYSKMAQTRSTPEHNVMHPVHAHAGLGPIDYTPGGFRNVHAEATSRCRRGSRWSRPRAASSSRSTSSTTARCRCVSDDPDVYAGTAKASISSARCPQTGTRRASWPATPGKDYVVLARRARARTGSSAR
jgi:alpha-glucosidase